MKTLLPFMLCGILVSFSEAIGKNATLFESRVMGNEKPTMNIKLGYVIGTGVKWGSHAKGQLCTFVALNNMLAITTGQCVENIDFRNKHPATSQMEPSEMYVVDFGAETPITRIEMTEKIYGEGNKMINPYTTMINLGVFTFKYENQGTHQDYVEVPFTVDEDLDPSKEVQVIGWKRLTGEAIQNGRAIEEMRVVTFQVVDKELCRNGGYFQSWSEELDCLKPNSPHPYVIQADLGAPVVQCGKVRAIVTYLVPCTNLIISSRTKYFSELPGATELLELYLSQDQ